MEDLPSGVQQFHFNSKNEKTGILENAVKFADYLADEKPDIVLSSFLAANDATALGRMMAPTAQADTPLIVRHITDYNRHLKNPIIRGLMSFAYQAADQVVAICHDMVPQILDVMNNGLITNKVKVVYPPSIDEKISQKAAEKTGVDWLDNCDDPKNNLQVIVGVGRLVGQKDFITLIEAFAKIHEQRPESRLVIVGEGDERQKLEQRIAELGIEDKVALPGYTANPYAVIDKASVFVLSSIYEGLGKVVAESIALGTPVVVSDCPVGPSELSRMQPESQIFPVKDSDAAADCLIKALDAEKKRGSRKVPVPDMRNHHIDGIVAQFEAIAIPLIEKRELTKKAKNGLDVGAWLQKIRHPEKQQKPGPSPNPRPRP